MTALMYHDVVAASVSPELGDLFSHGKTWSVAAGVVGPIFQGGRIKRSYEAAQAQWQQAKIEYEAAAANAFGEVSGALVDRTKLVETERQRARAVAAYLLLARDVGAAPALPERTSGAVALYLAAKAPTPIRAVISGHALRASDADWEFGHGPVLEQQAIPMIEFLLGRGTTAPRRATDHPR